MKTCFEEPNMEVIRFEVEDILTSSSILRTAESHSGFDEIEQNWSCICEFAFIPPCG